MAGCKKGRYTYTQKMVRRHHPKFKEGPDTPVLRNGMHQGVMHNHPAYEHGDTLETVHFECSKTGKVRGIIDVKTGDMYCCPPAFQRPEAAESAAKICNDRNVPYIDHSKDFSIAVPIDFYIELAKEVDLPREVDNAVLFKKLLEERWKEKLN